MTKPKKIKKSPVKASGLFHLPFGGILVKGEDNETVLYQTEAQKKSKQPYAGTNRFINLGRDRKNTGICHTLYLNKRPLSDTFSLGESFKISGITSYSYIKTGSMVAGILFASPVNRTWIKDYKLVVQNSDSPDEFKPVFDLEKLGLVFFVASDSSVLVIPNHVSSSLLVTTD